MQTLQVKALDEVELKALDGMVAVLHDKLEVVAFGEVEVGSYCSYVGSPQSLRIGSNKVFYVITSQTLICSHSTFKSGVVSVPTFSIRLY